MLGVFFILFIFILLSKQGLEQICDEMFDKIEQQSESKLILDQLEESLLITSESESQIEYVNDHFLDQFQPIIEKLETSASHENIFLSNPLLTADKAKTLFDLNIDEEVIKEQPND